MLISKANTRSVRSTRFVVERLLLVAVIHLLVAAICTVGVVRAARAQDSSLPTSLPAQAPVIDQAGVLTANEIADLQLALRSIDARYGVRAGVVIVPSVKPDGIEAYANALGNEWHIGARKGLIVVVAVQDHAARIEVSRDLEGLMPDLYTHQVLHEAMTPAFAQGRFFAGLSAGLARLSGRLNEGMSGAELAQTSSPVDQRKRPSANEVQGFVVGQVLAIGIPLFFGFVGWMLEALRRWWSVIYALVVGASEFGLACVFLDVHAAAVVGVLCGLLAATLVWWQATKLEARLRKLAPQRAAAERRRAAKPAPKPRIKRAAAAAAGAGVASSAWADSSSSSSSSSSASSSSSSSSSDSSSGDFGGGGSSDNW